MRGGMDAARSAPPPPPHRVSVISDVRLITSEIGPWCGPLEEWVEEIRQRAVAMAMGRRLGRDD